jgi:hypothetical protein
MVAEHGGDNFRQKTFVCVLKNGLDSYQDAR